MLEPVPSVVTEIQTAVREAQNAIAETAATIEYAIGKVINAGRKLRTKREEAEHGDWMEWLRVNVLEPLDITYQTTRNWIKLSEFADTKGEQLDDAGSVRQAYLLAGLLPESESSNGGGGGKVAGNYLVHISRLERAIKTQIEARPIKEWSSEDKKILRQRLMPLVALLEQLEAA